MEMKEQIGEYIRKNRKKNRMSQETLAEKSGISVNHISKIERGLASPKFETVVRICVALDVSLDYFLYMNWEKENESGEGPYKDLMTKMLEEEMRLRLKEAVMLAIDETGAKETD